MMTRGGKEARAALCYVTTDAVLTQQHHVLSIISLLIQIMTANKDEKRDWKAIAAEKQRDRQARLPLKWLVQDQDLPSKDVLDVMPLIVERKWLNEEELAITGLSVVDLAAAIKKRKYTAVAAVEAYAHRATIAQQLVNPYVLDVFLEVNMLTSHQSHRDQL